MQWYINHTICYISPSESFDDEVIYNTFVVHLFIIHTYSCQYPCSLFYSTTYHKNLLSLLHNPTLPMLGLLQISCIITNPFSDSPLWVKVKCLDIHILNLATHQTPHSNTSLPHTVSSRISQLMVLVHHICLEPQP